MIAAVSLVRFHFCLSSHIYHLLVCTKEYKQFLASDDGQDDVSLPLRSCVSFSQSWACASVHGPSFWEPHARVHKFIHCILLYASGVSDSMLTKSKQEIVFLSMKLFFKNMGPQVHA